MTLRLISGRALPPPNGRRSHDRQARQSSHLKQAASIADELYPDWDHWASLRADWHVLMAEQEAEEVEQ